MKNVIAGILIGVLLGLLIGGLYWSPKYIEMSNKYNNAIELLRLYKNYVEQYENPNN